MSGERSALLSPDLAGLVLVAWGGLQLLGAALVGIVFAVLGGSFAAIGLGTGGDDGAAMAIVGGVYGLLGLGIAGLAAVMALPSVLAGLGLRRRAGWARILAILLAILSLASPPFGTAVGVYLLVVLLDARVAAEFQERSGRRDSSR